MLVNPNLINESTALPGLQCFTRQWQEYLIVLPQFQLLRYSALSTPRLSSIKKSRGWGTGKTAQQVKYLPFNCNNSSSNLRSHTEARRAGCAHVIPTPGRQKGSVNLPKHNSSTVDMHEFTHSVKRLQSTDQDSRISIPSFLRGVQVMLGYFWFIHVVETLGGQPKASVLGFQVCCHRLLQTKYLKTTDIILPGVVDSAGRKSRCLMG